MPAKHKARHEPDCSCAVCTTDQVIAGMRTSKEIDADPRYWAFANPMRYAYWWNRDRARQFKPADNGDAYRRYS